MQARIITSDSVSLVGTSTRMSLVANRTTEVWRRFMTESMRINDGVGFPRYSVQVYEDPNYFAKFNPAKPFTKWACIAQGALQNIPKGFDPFQLAGGLYAVFDYKGTAADFGKMAQRIYGEWLPNSAYELDHRPHFEVLDERYKNDDPESEEEIWIPIKSKAK